MAAEAYTNLTGTGHQAFSAAFEAFAVNIAVTALGSAQQIDGAYIPRYAKVGWWALYEHVGTLSSPFPNANYVHAKHWIEFQNSEWYNTNNYPFETGGCDGFIWFLYPGVTASFNWNY